MTNAHIIELAKEETLAGVAVKLNQPNQYRWNNLGLEDLQVLASVMIAGAGGEEEDG